MAKLPLPPPAETLADAAYEDRLATAAEHINFDLI
jgi:hypothetical protein